jgi:hypothetical protein
MAFDAVVQLQRLRCVTLKRTEARTEPYIWPVLLRVDEGTLANPDPLNQVAVSAPIVGNSRVVIKDSMRAGESAGISPVVGVLRSRFEDNLSISRLILVVALLENDESPRKAVDAGFQTFVKALREEVSSHLQELNSTQGEERAAVIRGIQDRVRSRVKSAVSGALSTWEKIKVGAGILNLDDAVESDFLGFGEPVLAATSFTMTFETAGSIIVFPTLQKYEIDGRLDLRPLVIDRCQAQVDAVNAAREVVNGIEKQVQALKDALGEASPADKEIIKLEIAELRDEALPAAEAELERALRELTKCRAQVPTNFPTDGVVLEASTTPHHDHEPSHDNHEREAQTVAV